MELVLLVALGVALAPLVGAVLLAAFMGIILLVGVVLYWFNRFLLIC